MLMQHPFTFRLGGANITLTTNDRHTTVKLHDAGVSQQQVEGKFVAIGVDMRESDEFIVLSLLTTTGEREYRATLIEINGFGELKRNYLQFSTDEDLTGESIGISYNEENHTCVVNTLVDDNTLIASLDFTAIDNQQ